MKNFKLTTQTLGQPLVYMVAVESTQDVIRQRFLDTPKHGLTVLSSHQTRGRGQQGKNWVSLPGEHLFFSILLQSTLEEKQMPLINLMTAVALKKTLETMGIKNIQIKWPNDILVNQQKISGILSEKTFVHNKPWIILGIGINVNETGDLNAHIDQPYTSVSKELGQKISLESFFNHFLCTLEKDFNETEKDPRWLQPYFKTLLNAPETNYF